MPRLLQELASRWYHLFVCLVLTIDVYVSAYLDEQFDDFDVAVGARAVDGKGPEVVAVVCVRAAA